MQGFIPIGGSKGPPLWVQLLSFSRSFQEKNGQIIGLRSHLGSWRLLPRLGNPGSATDSHSPPPIWEILEPPLIPIHPSTVIYTGFLGFSYLDYSANFLKRCMNVKKCWAGGVDLCRPLNSMLFLKSIHSPHDNLHIPYCTINLRTRTLNQWI